MAQVQAAEFSPSPGDNQSINQREAHTQGGKVSQVNLKGRPVDRSKTGAWRAALFIYGLILSEFETLVFGVTLVPYLSKVMHQAPAKAATITTNYLGTGYVLSVFGGFIADSYLGAYWTIAAALVASMFGCGLMTFSASYSGLQPSNDCIPKVNCKPAGAHYMAPLFVGLYAIALGGGLAKPNLLSLGADQFDKSVPKEKEQGTHFFIYAFFCTQLGIFLGVTFGVYLIVNVSAGWGYGYSLMLYGIGATIFFLGTPSYRHRRPTGSFLTRMAQVLVAALRKWKVGPALVQSGGLYDPRIPVGSMLQKLDHTSNLRFLDRAATLTGTEEEEVSGRGISSWRLTPITQVEETKRILQMVPVWVCLIPVALVYSQLSTFSIQMSETMDRSLGPHFTIPSPSFIAVVMVAALAIAPLYDRVIVPIVRRFNNNPYGFTPLQRLTTAILAGTLTCIATALIERKRLTYVRELHYEHLILGTYELPMTVWWFVPQYFLTAIVEFTFWVSSYEFFYHETGAETRSIASSLTYAAFGVGSFLNTLIVNLINSITRHQQGGSWMKGQLNNGGLEKFFWLLSSILAVDFLIFLVVSSLYRYKYDWYHERQETDVPVSNDLVDSSARTENLDY